jgi:hypothetical protein
MPRTISTGRLQISLEPFLDHTSENQYREYSILSFHGLLALQSSVTLHA